MTQIRKCIAEGEYNLGDKLPSENELTKIFQISRPSVRDGALQPYGFGTN